MERKKPASSRLFLFLCASACAGSRPVEAVEFDNLGVAQVGRRSGSDGGPERSARDEGASPSNLSGRTKFASTDQLLALAHLKLSPKRGACGSFAGLCVTNPSPTAIQRSNSDAPIIAARSAMLLQPDAIRKRATPTANRGTAATPSIFFGRGLRRQLSLWTWRSPKNA